MTTSSESGTGISIRSLLRSAPDSAVREFISPPVRELLAIVDPEMLAGARLRELVATLWTNSDLLREEPLRSHLLQLLPFDKARELGATLGFADSTGLTERLITLDASSRRIQEQLARFFGVADPQGSAHSGFKPTCAVSHASFELFAYQRTVVRDLMAGLARHPRRVVLHLPTGAGKTRVAMDVICEHLRRHEPGVVMWMAYNRELLEQAASAFESAWSSLGNRDLPIIRYWGSTEYDFSGTADAMIVAGLGKLDALANRDYQALARLADQTALTVIDEAHQSVAHTYRQLLELFATKRPDASLLGLTATPGRTWADIDADAEVADFFGHQKVTLHVEGHPDPVTFLMEDGYLAKPTFVTLNIDAGLIVTDADLGVLSDSLDIPADLLRRLADSQQRNLRILECTEQLLRRHRRVILFATTVGHARLLAAILRVRGHAAETVTAETSWADRESAIQRYRSNSARPMILCNYGVLTTGFDAPSTSAALIARPTRSLVLYSQMVGRAIRGPRSGGNKRAEIVTVVDLDLPGFGEIAEAFNNWEDVWR